MSLRLKESEPLDSALRRLAIECIDVALTALDGNEGRDVAIHTVRKQCKQIRALLRLFRDGLGDEWRREARFFRDLARSLAVARDSSVALDVHAALVEGFGSSIRPAVAATIRQRLIAEYRTAFVRPQAPSLQPPDNDSLRAQLLGGRARSRRWKLLSGDEAILERGLLRSYRQARRAMLHACTTGAVEDLHELRKHAKCYWHQLEFVAKRWPDCALKRTAPVRRLTQTLGDVQDMVVYRNAIERAAQEACADGVALFGALAERRRQTLEAQALALAQQAFAEKPKQLRAEMRQPEPLRQASG